MPQKTVRARFAAWIVITRAPFLSASVVPVIIAAAWVLATHHPSLFPWGFFLLALAGAVSLHTAANMFNDYFDWRSGTDPGNTAYFHPFTGGSRAIERGLIGEKGTFIAATALLCAAALAGVPLLAARGPLLLVFGAIGALSGFLYTAPPFCLAARWGIGELVLGLNFGPLIVAGSVFAMTGGLSAADFCAGLPIGLLTTAILWINQFPDAESDALAGRRNLVIIMGKRSARWGYLLLVTGAFAVTAEAVADGVFPPHVLIMFVAIPLAIRANAVLFRSYESRNLVRANVSTIQLQLLCGLLMAAGLFWAGSY